MRRPILCKPLALLSLLSLLVLAPAHGACACNVSCEDASPCEEMTAEKSAHGHERHHEGHVAHPASSTFEGTAQLEGCHHSSVAPTDLAVLPRSNEDQSSVALLTIPPGSTADRVARPTASPHDASQFRPDRSSDRYILFASFLS